MPDKTQMTLSTDMVMVTMLAELQADRKDLADLSPEEIKERIDRTIADLRFAQEVVNGRT